jgi:hypothetical protein
MEVNLVFMAVYFFQWFRFLWTDFGFSLGRSSGGLECASDLREHISKFTANKCFAYLHIWVGGAKGEVDQPPRNRVKKNTL